MHTTSFEFKVFLSPKPVAIARLKRLVCPTILPIAMESIIRCLPIRM